MKSQTVLALEQVSVKYAQLSQFVESLEELIQDLTEEQKRFLFKSLVECDAFTSTRREYIACNPAKEKGHQFLKNSPELTEAKRNAKTNHFESPKLSLTELIIRVLKNNPKGLTASEIFEQLKDDYKTISKNPKGVIYPALSQMVIKGKLRKNGKLYLVK